jgi:hypothetical protein
VSLWGSKDQANNAPKYKILPDSPNTGVQLYGTTVVGLDKGEIHSGKKASNPGWVRVQYGTGPVTSLTITAAGTGYSNSDTVKVSGGTVNAAANVVTNGNGVITAVNLSSGGKGFTNVSSATVTITTGAGAGATLTPVLGGRAGRVQTEVLVTVPSMSANNSTL